MSRRDIEVSELDLLAYADGLLDDSPERRKLVETYLSTRPDEAERVHAYTIQNRQIRARYDYVLAEPVPPALRAILDGSKEHRRRGGLATRIAAALALVVLGAGGGWMADDLVTGADTDASEFAARVAAGYHAVVQSYNGAPAARQTVLGLLPEQVAVNIDVPDLSAIGLVPVDRRRLASNGGSSEVRIEYAGVDGKRVVLVVGTRWQEQLPEVEIVETDDLAVAVWQDGPLRYGLAAEADNVLPLRQLAETIVRHQEREIEAVPVKPRDLRAVDVGSDAGAPTGQERPRNLPPDPTPKRSPRIN
jgi:anti-sigma factor RsiW